MKKTFCDVCKAEMPDWNDSFDLTTPLNGEFMIITGSIKAERHILFEATEHRDRHSVDVPVDLCRDCFVDIMKSGRLRPDLPSSTGLG